MGNSVGVFGFVCNYLEIFDLDGHNLGTIQLNYGSLPYPTSSFQHNLIIYIFMMVHQDGEDDVYG